MIKLLKLIYQFFLTVYIFESYPKFNKVNKNKISIFFIKSANKAKINKTKSPTKSFLDLHLIVKIT